MNKIRLFLATLFPLAPFAVHAATLDDLPGFLRETTFSGNLRAYDFNRIYSPGTQNVQPSQSAFSLGGRLDAQTGTFLSGFSLGVGFLTANSLGANDTNSDFAHLDSTLAGTRSSITAIGQAFLQYRYRWLTLKAGDQYINTPWINDSDSRMLPATYQGVVADAVPLDHWHITGLRIFRWKSRTSNDYFQNNLYYSPTYDGDDLRGGTGTKLATADTQGAAALGSAYDAGGLKVNLWYYSFQQFADSVYNDSKYTLTTGSGFSPFIGDQFMRQWKSNSMLDDAPVNTIKGEGVDNVTYSGKAGLDSPYGQLMFAYIGISDHQGSVGNGALISPYTVGYTTDPLDTSSMIRGMVDLGPGNGWKLRYSDSFLDKQLTFTTAFARYHSETYHDSNNTYLDIIWSPGFFKGFSIRNRAEDAVVADSSSGLNPGSSKIFFYDRLQLQYVF